MLKLLLLLAFLGQSDPIARAQVLAQQGKVLQAIDFLKSQGRHEPSAPLFAFLAQLQTAVDRIPQAAKSLERALDLAPRQNRLRVTRAALLYRMRRFEEAQSELESVLRQEPENALAHYYLASVFQWRAEFQRALDSAEKAVELMPPPTTAMSFERQKYSLKAGALHLVAELQFELGRDIEPIARSVLEIEPLHSPARYLLAKSLMARGKTDEAKRELAVFDKIVKADEHVEFALNSLYFGGDVQQAVTSLFRALEYYPDHDRALFFIGRLLVQVGRVEQGSQYLRRCLELRPAVSDLVDPLLAQANNK